MLIAALVCLHFIGGLAASEGNFNLTWHSLATSFNSIIHPIIKSSLPTALRVMSEANVSSSCERGLMAYIMALQRSKGWAFKMLDATSKIPSGLLRGTSMDFGEFEQCLKIRVPEASRKSTSGTELFRGRYCTVGSEWDILITLWRKDHDPNYTYPYGDPPDVVKEMVSILEGTTKEAKYFFGLCIPSLCSEIDIHQILQTILKPLQIKVFVVDCQVDEPYVWPVHSLVAVLALVSLASICAVGTTLDIIRRRRSDSAENKEATKTNEHTFFRILKAFSVLANAEKVFKYGGDDNALRCIHGIRFLTATWIMLGHTYMYPDVWRHYIHRNVLKYLEYSDDISMAIIESMTLAVDTFYFLSGFLLVYSTWKQMKKNEGKLNLCKFFTNKYLRMTPGVALVMTLLMAMPVIGSGPLWHSELKPYIENCQNSWWANFLYINSFQNTKLICLDFTWYLADLMQFHILGVILLIIFYRSRIQGVILGLLFTAICTVAVMLQVLLDNPRLPKLPSFMGMKDLDLVHEFGGKIYIKPHFHFTCYLIGMSVAYLLNKYKKKPIDLKYQFFGWLLAVGVALFSVLGVYAKDNSKAYITFYTVMYRPAWTMAFGWLTYMCASGSGGFVNRLLSLRMMEPLSQLSYLIYLIQPLIIIYKHASQRERIYFGHTEQVFDFFSTLLASILLAFIGCVTVEIPFQNLHKIMFETRETFECGSDKHKDDNPVHLNNIKNPPLSSNSPE